MRIFISAVTSEFGKARDALASDLRAQGHTVTVQSDFQQSPDSETLLGALADYIRDCHAVICIVGKRSGACPPPRAADRLPGVLPQGVKDASYTQWEFFLARYFKRRPYAYIALDDYNPDQNAAQWDRADLQSGYFEFLRTDGVHCTKFPDAKELRIAVLRDVPKIAAEPVPSSSPLNTQSYLETVVVGANPDLEAIKRFRSDLRPEIKLRFPPELSAVDFLKSCGVMPSGNLTRAGLLMFGEDPQAAIPQSVCHFTIYDGLDQSGGMEPQKVFGVIPDQIKKITDILKSRIRRREQFDAGSGKVLPNYEYPMLTLREIIANAFVHRAYEYTDRKVHVRVFTDRIEVVNPGKWNGPSQPSDDGSPIGLDKLISNPVNKNERLASILSWTDLVEGEGSGLPKAVAECAQMGVRVPLVKQEEDFISVTVFPIPYWDRGRSGPRIYISAVASEFGKARDLLAADLRARGCTVVVQSDFRQRSHGETLLKAIANYIRDSHAVICIVGNRSGAYPPVRAIEGFEGVLPNGIKGASYAEWEFFLARYFKRQRYAYVARADYEPDQEPASGESGDHQSAYFAILKAEGAHYTSFSSAEQLRIDVLRDVPKLATEPVAASRQDAKTIVLPYPSIGDLFKGREEFLRRLHDSLAGARGGRAAIVSQALYGLGGIGKTRAAVEYAWSHVDDYAALLFVVAESAEALRRNLAALARALVPQLDATDDVVRLAAVLDWLKANPGWFLILDNVDSRPALAEVEHLLSGLTGGHVVVTSRLADFSGNFQPLELDVLTVEDAAAFLQARTDDRRRAMFDDEAKAREVAQELGQLALGLEQAAAFIAKRRLSFAQYLEQWRSKRDEVLAWFDATVTGYPRAVAVTWQTSVAQLSEGGRRLLERLAWLAPEKVPESLLDVPIPGAEAENLRAAFDDLAAFSLVTRDAEGPFFLVHRLVQDVTRQSLAEEARQRSLVEALGWINTAFTGIPSDVRNWPTLDPLAPHARIVTAHADAASIQEPTARLLNELGLLLSEKALHAEAEPLLRRALAIDEKSFGPDHPNVAIRLNNLAVLLQATNRSVQAEPMIRSALAIDEKSFGSDHPKVAIRLNNLAVLLQDANIPAEAEPLMRRALAIGEKSLGPDHPNVAIRLNNLAQVLKDTNRLVEAEPLMRRALAIDEKSFGPDHPEVATDLNNLAELLRATNRLAEAEPLMRRALGIDERSFGPDHPTVATRLSNLAGLLQATDRLAEAEPLMRRALAIDEKSLGTDHPNVATRLNNLAQFLRATNRLVEAEPLMRRALAIDERSFGPDHPNVAIDLNNLAQFLRATNRLVEAEPLMRRALAIDERSFGPDHPNVAIDLNNLAQFLRATNRLVEAEPLLRNALAIDEKSLGPDHPDVAIDLNNLAGLLQATNRFDEAEPLMRRQFAIFVEFTRQTGHRHPHLDAAFANYAGLLKAMGKSLTEIEAACAELMQPLS